MAKRGWPAEAWRRIAAGATETRRVDGDHAGLVGKNRIEIDLANLGKIRHQLRQLDQKERDRASWSAAGTLR